MKDVAIVSAATGFTSASGKQYILIFHECLYMPELSHTLINPNQLRHCHTQVQDNPCAKEPMSITSPDVGFVACLESERDQHLSQHMVADADRSCIPPTHRTDLTTTLGSAQSRIPSYEILCEGGNGFP